MGVMYCGCKSVSLQIVGSSYSSVSKVNFISLWRAHLINVFILECSRTTQGSGEVLVE